MLKGCQNFFTALHFKAKPDSAQVVSLSILNPARDHRQLVELAMDAMTAVFGRSYERRGESGRGRGINLVPVLSDSLYCARSCTCVPSSFTLGPEEHMEQPPVLIKDHKELSALC